ncbi:MAG TPA: hypothetical protein VML75_12665 [Kofleriaceae bacterium]|nr:hypothetical protein [Kofleriaceae bacterium]
MRWLVLTALWIGQAASAHAQPVVDADHRITIVDPAPVAVGERGAISVTIAAEAGYSISREGPLSITVTAPPGIDPHKKRYARADAADARADDPRFDLRYQVQAAGEHRLDVRLRFWVCATRSCRPVDAQRTVVVAATLAPSP